MHDHLPQKSGVFPSVDSTQVPEDAHHVHGGEQSPGDTKRLQPVGQ